MAYRFPLVFSVGVLIALVLLAFLFRVQAGPKAEKPGPGADAAVRFVSCGGTLSEVEIVPRVTRNEEEWKLRMTPLEFKVGREHGTEWAFSGEFHDHKAEGIYSCSGCGLPLFDSKTKYDSGTGWPSFYEAIAPANVASSVDAGFGMVREEVHCARCGNHLGHVFNDGPPPTGRRFCINSVVLNFDMKNQEVARETVYFGAGCFWGVEEAFSKIPGVLSTEVGYAGGHTQNPTYEQVCKKDTGHAEVVKVVYDPSATSLETLLETFWKIHNPTRVTAGVGASKSQYRSAVFFTAPAQEFVIREFLAGKKSENQNREIQTEVDLAPPFFRAEEYHQKYAEKHGGGFCHVPES